MLYPREITSKIIKWLDKDQIIVLVGSRQVGKTSLMHLIKGELIRVGVGEGDMHFFDLEDFRLLEIFNQGPGAVLELMQPSTDKRHYLFVDEIQYLKNPANFLKLMHDHYPQIKLIVTGSSSLDIKKKFKDSLAGRKVVFEIQPLTFAEYLLFSGKKDLSKAILEYRMRFDDADFGMPSTSFLTAHGDELTGLYNNFLLFGGYPAVTLESDNEIRIKMLLDIYHSYVRKDINALFAIEEVTSFNKLVQLIAQQCGNLANITELSSSAGLSKHLVDKYLFILENTFIILLLTPFARKKRKEVIRMPKIYFLDTGLRNTVIRQMTEISYRTDLGAIAETGVLAALLKRNEPLYQHHFWRNQNKLEVDFIIESPEVIPVEVKYQTMNDTHLPGGLASFIEAYHPKIAFVATKNFAGKRQIGGTTVRWLPAWLY